MYAYVTNPDVPCPQLGSIKIKVVFTPDQCCALDCLLYIYVRIQLE